MMRLRFYVRSGNVWGEVENVTADSFKVFDGGFIYGVWEGKISSTYCRIGAGRAEFSTVPDYSTTGHDAPMHRAADEWEEMRESLKKNA